MTTQKLRFNPCRSLSFHSASDQEETSVSHADKANLFKKVVDRTVCWEWAFISYIIWAESDYFEMEDGLSNLVLD